MENIKLPNSLLQLFQSKFISKSPFPIRPDKIFITIKVDETIHFQTLECKILNEGLFQVTEKGKYFLYCFTDADVVEYFPEKSYVGLI